MIAETKHRRRVESRALVSSAREGGKKVVKSFGRGSVKDKEHKRRNSGL